MWDQVIHRGMFIKITGDNSMFNNREPRTHSENWRLKVFAATFVITPRADFLP